MKERLYIKDKVDGQQHCLSGDESFYLIDVTDQYSKMVEVPIEGMLEWLKNTRREIIKMLDTCIEEGLLKQKERDVFYFRHIDWNSLENCGKQFCVTRERIRQIEAKVLEVLRSRFTK